MNGIVTEIIISEVNGKRPLGGKQLADFKIVVEHHAEQIVQKWIDYFVNHRAIRPVTITRKLR